MSFHGSAGATTLVGMPGFEVGVQTEIDGEWWLYVQTVDRPVACPGCGVRATSHGRRRVKVRDLPISGRGVVLCWAKRLWRCTDPDCETKTWSEESAAVEPGGLLSVRAGVEICRLVGAEGVSVAAAARAFGVSWAAAMACVRRHGRPLVDDTDRTSSVTGLGVDETVFRHAARTRRTAYVTGMVDVVSGVLLDVVEGRSGAVVVDWLDAQGPDWRAAVRVGTVDAFTGYANALAATLPDATIVLDCFHAIAIANRALDAVRRRVQHDTLGHRGRRHDPLWRVRRLALMGAERLDETGWARLADGLDVGDPTGEMAAAWIAKEELRRVYKARDPHAARRALTRFYLHCAEHSDVPEILTLATTISTWQPAVLAYHDTGRASNGPTEAVNLLIEKTRRIGHGFRNFDNYRLRLLLACGIKWKTPQVARIRGHKPRSVA